MACHVQANLVSRRMEYHGQVADLTKALVDVANGGQIIIDGTCGMASHMTVRSARTLACTGLV